MKYLFSEGNQIYQQLKNKHIFIFLDYDGTLTPIVNNPDKARLSGGDRKLLRQISEKQNLKLAFISGRSLKDIKSKIGLRNVIYSGNHGLEIEGPKIKFQPQVSPGYRRILERIKDDLSKKISSIKGAFVEDKGLSLSLHYRLVDKAQVSLVKTIFREAVILSSVKNEIKVKTGKMIIEVRPPVNWDKGKVVLWLLSRQSFAAKRGDIFPIYIGDDVTDEDAFKALNNKGLTIFVGGQKESSARYYLKNSGEVMSFLKEISRI